jgi:protein-tyrosine phosphatase
MQTERLAPDLDANWVVGTLYQGGRVSLSETLVRNVDVVVLSAKEWQPEFDRYVTRGLITVRKIPMEDNGVSMTEYEKHRAYIVARHMRRALDKGLTVLSTCHAGLNRSGLLSALALMLPSPVMSATPSGLKMRDAVAYVRKARGPKALRSEPFLEFLCAYQCMRNC